jgi:hypothetical protein
MGMKKTMVVVAAMLLLFASSAFAQGAYFAAADAAQQQMQKLTDELIEMRKAKFEADRAEKVREQLVGTDGREGLMKTFRDAVKELDSEITKLKVNPKDNAEELKKLNAAKKSADAAKANLTKLQSYMMDNGKMKLALKNGTLEKFATEANKAMKKSAEAIKAANESTSTAASSGDDKPGTIQIETKVKSGKVRIFVTGHDGTEQEIFEKGTVKITKFPVVIRASVQDTEKVRLESQHGGGNANWDPKPNPNYQHVYAYEGSSGGGRSEWTAREEYKFTASENKQLLRSIGQRNSDGSTVKATGDIVELSPAKAIAQGITIDLSAKSLKWERKSKFTGSTQEKKADVVSKDNAASAQLVISFFPAGT